ncbi:hypothetical protein NDU88_005668 [Pleurodeles waltl]|uniref:Uncharacterized protein n=1 Tax=Pleurodeles waltl TaxID=8319 RepID=A0AAV7WCH4_PLEWA|nr:hypothetical protein NDU88_005668 [Pleurodeles waltl]
MAWWPDGDALTSRRGAAGEEEPPFLCGSWHSRGGALTAKEDDNFLSSTPVLASRAARSCRLAPGGRSGFSSLPRLGGDSLCRGTRKTASPIRLHVVAAHHLCLPGRGVQQDNRRPAPIYSNMHRGSNEKDTSLLFPLWLIRVSAPRTPDL